MRLLLFVVALAGCDLVFQAPLPRDASMTVSDAGDAIQPAGVAVERFTVTRLAFTTAGSVPHTVGAFTGRLLVVAVSTSYATTVASSVTYGDAALTRIGVQDAEALDGRIELWSLVDPPTGTADVAITVANTASSVVAGIGSFSGVGNDAPLGVFSTARGTAGDPTVTTPSATDELVLGFAMWNGDYSTLAAPTDHVVHWNENASAMVSIGSTRPGAAMTTMTWAVDRGFDDYWAAGAVAIRP